MGFSDWIKETFSRTPVKESPLGLDFKYAYNLARVGLSGRPQRPDHDAASLISWHRKNELVYACVEKICEAALDPELTVERRNSKGEWEPEPEHPLRRLMKRPNPLDDEGSFLGSWLASEHVAGRFYAEIVRSPAGLPVQLWPLSPAKTVPVAGSGEDGNPIAGFEYRDGGKTVRLKTRDVLYRHNRDLLSPFQGLSPLQVALGAVDADAAQTDYVRAFFNNDGTPSGLLTSDQRLTQTDVDAAEQRWAQKYARGGSKQKGTAVLGQGLSYNRVGSNLDELESAELRMQGESRICTVFGVPPLLVGAYVGLKLVNQRASAREAQADFWTNKMSPLFKRLRTYLTWSLLPLFEGIDLVAADRVRVSWDMSRVIALQEDTDSRHKRARENVAAGIWTVNEGREQTGVEPDPEGDYYVRPFTVSAVDPAQALAVQKVPQGKEPKSAKGVKVFEFEGLSLSREPNTAEKAAVKGVATAQDGGRERVKKVLLECRARLYAEAVDALSAMKVSEYPALTLEASGGERKALRKNLNKIYFEGAKQIRAELTGQGAKLDAFSGDFKSADELNEELDDLTDATLSRVIGDVQSRAISLATSLFTLGIAADDLRKRLKDGLGELSESPQEQAASMAANRALAMGRADEGEARKDEWGVVQYSAILDRNTCSACEAEDGKEAADVSDLAPAPNTDCEGMALCRCFHVYIAK